MDATHIFYSRPSYLSSFKIYHANDLYSRGTRQYGGRMALTPTEKGLAKFILGIAETGVRLATGI